MTHVCVTHLSELDQLTHYPVACVEVVSKSSEKAGILYLKPDVIEDDSYLLTTGRTWA